MAERDRTEPDEEAEKRSTPYYRQLWFLVVIAITLGILFGLLFEEQALETQWLAEAFIQLIKAVTGPVIFVTVVIGIASLGDMARAGGLALRALGYFLAMTVIAPHPRARGGQPDRAGRRVRGRRSPPPPVRTPRRRSARRAATRGSSASSPATCCRRASSRRSWRTRSCACSCSRC